MESISGYENDTENLTATELRLGLPGTEVLSPPPQAQHGKKRALVEENKQQRSSNGSEENNKPPAKERIVGWPPVRKNSFQGRKVEVEQANGHYVKVSMDGAPYLRKIDLNVYKSYKELKGALENMFKCFSSGSGVSGMLGQDGFEYAITYEDKDGDWMLVGDVPFEMFTTSCKRLRIMKGSEARGLSASA